MHPKGKTSFRQIFQSYKDISICVRYILVCMYACIPYMYVPVINWLTYKLDSANKLFIHEVPKKTLYNIFLTNASLEG